MIETIIVGLIALLAGGGVAFLVSELKRIKEKQMPLSSEANKEAEQIKKEKLLQAKEKFIELKI